MNKVKIALDAARALVRTVALAQGADFTENRLAALDAADAISSIAGSDHPYRLIVDFTDAPPTTIGTALGPPSYELLVQPTVAVVVIGPASAAIPVSAAFADALAAALEADRTLGGGVGWAEIADNPEDQTDFEFGVEAFADVLTIALNIPDARSARG
jgi:hypothetical protein